MAVKYGLEGSEIRFMRDLMNYIGLRVQKISFTNDSTTIGHMYNRKCEVNGNGIWESNSDRPI